jgi:hypothetical protein
MPAEPAEQLAAEAPSAERIGPEAQRAEPFQSETEDAYRERVVAKVERSLASLDAGRGVPHAEVLAMLDVRYPGSK